MSENTMQNPYAKVTGMLLYTCIQEAVDAYKEKGAPEKPKEWKTSVVITDEDYVDSLEEWANSQKIKLSLIRFRY